MPASLRKYYKRSRKLILTRYKKLKDENKQACDLMLQYNDDLWLAHMMKEWFYDISQIKSDRKQQQEFDDWISNARGCSIKNTRDVRKPSILYCKFSDFQGPSLSH